MQRFWTTRQLATKFDSDVEEMRTFLRLHYPKCRGRNGYALPSSELGRAYRTFNRWKDEYREYSATQRKVAELQMKIQERTDSARQMAAMFGTTPERLRIFLREMFPNHRGHWRFSSEEIDELREALKARIATTQQMPEAKQAELTKKIDDDPRIRAMEEISRLLSSQFNVSPPQVKRRVIGQ